MGSAPLSFVAVGCALAGFFLPSLLCASNIVYTEKGSSVELPCSCPSCSGERIVNWLFNWNSNTTTIFHTATHSNLPVVLGRLAMLPNYSLHISNLTDSDTGRYWCEQTYYDLVVVTGTKRMIESGRPDVVCYVLSCSVSAKELVWDVASWWEGQKRLKEEDEKGRFSIFRGKRASQLHICLTEDQGKESKNNQEERRTKERRVKCRFAKKTEVTFSLTGTAKDGASVNHNHTLGLQSKGNGTSWIFLAAFSALLLVIVFVLGVALWRSHKQQEQLKECSKGASDSDSLMYENVQIGSEKLQHGNDPALH